MVVNVFSAIAGAGVVAGAILLLVRVSGSGHAAIVAVQQHVPEWLPPLMLLAGGAMLVLSILAHVGIAYRRPGMLVAHAILSALSIIGVVALAAWPHSHFSDLKHVAAAHKLSVTCVTVLVCVLLMVNLGGTLHVLVRIRREGLSFQQLVHNAEDEMFGKLRSQRNMAGAGAGRAHSAAAGLPGGPTNDVLATSVASELWRPAPAPDAAGKTGFSIELEDVPQRRYHETVSSRDFFAPDEF
eukprot:CAMPEP_0119429168 /NCGR_PEP_ID=MMETSP1335-20130426/41746_1 /TAXON_ID=259385 /ORGANISM="Chrysoculter rhomboideus, Strain RCC1486" /LENGTH=240 /DNA_ID=CAMNT_0007454881 /DNA_START=527 /DNA_END=1247 /DNA_ORIENTATION=-